MTQQVQQSQGFSAPIEELDDEDFAPPPPRRTSRVTVALSALAVLAVGFLGGALIQKHEGTASTTRAGAGTGRARGAFAAGAFGEGAGGFGGFGAAGGAGTGTTAGTGAAAGASGTTGTAGTASTAGTAGTTSTAGTAGPLAIGTVVSVTGDTLVVKDLGGKTHTLTIGSDVTLSTTTPLTASALKPGETVTVDGTTDAGGAATVTTVVRRS